MPNDLYYDLSAAVNLQNNYVNDLSSIYSKNTDNAADIAVQLNNLQSAISRLSSEYDKANSSSDSVLHHQQEMMNILQVEQQRLLAKKELFDQVEAENDRKVLLNTTYRKKYTQYTKITIVIIMVLVAIVIIRLMNKHLTIFPESLYMFLMIVVISIGIIYVLILYADLSARNNIDYDQIEIPPPKLDASGNLIVNSPAGRSIWSVFDTCKGSKCCSVGTSWSDQLSLCVVQPYNQGSSLSASAATVSPSTNVPKSTGPTTTGPKSTGPTTTGPTTTAPKTTAPKTTGPTTTGPTTTGPTTTAPKTTGPTTTGPTTTAPKTTAPKTTAPKTTAPKTTGPKGPVPVPNGPVAVPNGPVAVPNVVIDTVTNVAGGLNVGFTTMAQAVAYGDINQNMRILPNTVQITNAWMGDTSNVKPNAYLEYNHFQRI